MPLCPRCHSAHVKKDGHPAQADQRYRCRACHRTFTDRTGTPFASYRFPAEVILMAVRWYTLYRLSAVNVRDLLTERGIDVSARSVLVWVQVFGPLLAVAACRHARQVGHRWYADETYVRVAGRWAYLYRAIDEEGQVIDVLLREHRDLASARAFFAQAVARRGATPTAVVTDGHQAYGRAVLAHASGAVHTVTGLHRADGHETTQPVERSHVPVKDGLRPMRGLQSITTGQRLLESITVAQAIRRGDVTISAAPPPATPHQHARQVVGVFRFLAAELHLVG